MLMRRFKNALIELATSLFGDEQGLVTLPVCTGPARGMWMALSLRSGESAFVFGTYERAVTRRLAELCRSGWTVWDCGTHVGYDTLVCARAVGPEGTVIGFEPDASNRRRTIRNIAMNGVETVTIEPFAIGAPVGMVRFLSSGNQTSHIEGTYVGEAGCSRTDHQAVRGTCEVECISLDQAFLVKGVPLPNLIKLDLEGAEGDAVKHMTELVGACRPLLVVELHNTECAEALLAFARLHRYDLADLASGRSLQCMPLSPHVLCSPRSVHDT